MNQDEKNIIFEKASAKLAETIQVIEKDLSITNKNNAKIKSELPKANEDNKIVQQKLLEHGTTRARELESLIPSPYFMECVVTFDDDQDDMYFGKFSFTDKNIYSWITPAAAIRFEKPGHVSYIRPDGKKRSGILTKKDQYLITDEKITFLATESIDYERELVYQEYFSNKKEGFILPEIVARMEKAQDTVIRANHRGPFLISGPAGSGKTTLALHRVAYLAQSPDVSDQFKPTSIIVFVQDEGTRDYFSHLLPQLGIKGVTITTFAHWAMKVLDLQDYTYEFRFGETEKEKDTYEFKKFEALKNLQHQNIDKDIYTTLQKIYTSFSEREKELLEEQSKNKILDRFDLTILTTLYKKQHGRITLIQDFYKLAKKGAATKKTGRFPITYSLIIFDEFQNYLPEQIMLAKSTLEESNNAVMYIGDMAQQTQFGTISDWSEARESIKEDRKVLLQKVYRNTKHILEYIQSIGYDIQIDESLRTGEPVIEHIIDSKQKEIEYVRSLAQKETGSIGVLAKEKSYLDDFPTDLGEHIHLMSMNEAQGVEFDVVCIVGVNENMFTVKLDEEFTKYAEQKKRIHKDLLYVALTRAMNSLHILGNSKLKNVINW